jgi:hypothetical protein
MSVKASGKTEVTIVLMADFGAAQNGLETDRISSLSSVFVHTP